MIAWYPVIGTSALPSDFLLMKIGLPLLRMLFQVMVFFALLESGCGAVHAIMERLRHAFRGRGKDLSLTVRMITTLAVLLLSVLGAQRIGLVNLIAKGYGLMSWIMIAVFIVPLLVSSVRRSGADASLQ